MGEDEVGFNASEYRGMDESFEQFDEVEDDEEEEEDEEPEEAGPRTWAKVDEDALNRMALESFTDGSQQVTDAHTEKAMDAVIMDPLGKGILRMIDLQVKSLPRQPSKGLSPSTASTVWSPRLSSRDVLTMLPQTEQFRSECYLGCVHRDTPLEKLRDARKHLETHLSRGHGQLKALVKENFGRFISCKNTIEYIRVTLKHNEKDTSSDSAGTRHIMQSVQEAEQEVLRMWGPLLERQDSADRVRAALGALKRLHWVLAAPPGGGIGAADVDYDATHAAMRQYRRVADALSNSAVDSPLLRRLLMQTQKAVHNLRATTLKTLEAPGLAPSSARTIIHQLTLLQEEISLDSNRTRGVGKQKVVKNSLRPETNPNEPAPAWHYLKSQAKHLETEMTKFRDQHQSMLKHAQDKVQQQRIAEARWSATQEKVVTASHPNVPNTQKVEVSKHSHESDQIRSVGSSLDKTRGPKYSASVPKQESECLWCSGHDSLHELWVTLIASMSSLMASRLPPLLAVADQVANGQFEYPRESAASEPCTPTAPTNPFEIDDFAEPLERIVALYEAQLREAIHHLSEGITAEDATRASIESMRSIHAKEGVRRKEQDADETVEERIARTERDLCCLQRAVELIAVVSKATMDAGATALCARMEALQHEAVSRFMACNGVNVAAAVIRLIQHPDTRLALKGEAAAAAVAIDAEASPDARICQGVSNSVVDLAELLKTVLERFARLIRASGVVPSVGRLATTQLYSSIKTYAKGLSVQGSRLAESVWAAPTATSLNLATCPTSHLATPNPQKSPGTSLLMLLAGCRYTCNVLLPRVVSRLYQLGDSAGRMLFRGTPSNHTFLKVESELEELILRLQNLYVERRLQALHPTVDVYLTTSDLGFQKSQKGVKDLAKTPAFTDMPFQEMDGPKGIRDELLQVIHGLLAIQTEVLYVQPCQLEVLLPPCVAGMLTDIRTQCTQHLQRKGASLSLDGCMQLTLDVLFLEHILQQHLQDVAKVTIHELKRLIVQAVNSSQESVENIERTVHARIQLIWERELSRTKWNIGGVLSNGTKSSSE